MKSFLPSAEQALVLAHERSELYGNFFDCLKAAVFFGVPNRGADIAYWAAFAPRIIQAMQLYLGTGSNFVTDLMKNSPTFADISKQFIEREDMLNIRTFYETEKLYGRLVS
jgi:hypothetical protein